MDGVGERSNGKRSYDLSVRNRESPKIFQLAFLSAFLLPIPLPHSLHIFSTSHPRTLFHSLYSQSYAGVCITCFSNTESIYIYMSVCPCSHNRTVSNTRYVIRPVEMTTPSKRAATVTSFVASTGFCYPTRGLRS